MHVCDISIHIVDVSYVGVHAALSRLVSCKMHEARLRRGVFTGSAQYCMSSSIRVVEQG
jgi:hypothetical protein